MNFLRDLFGQSRPSARESHCPHCQLPLEASTIGDADIHRCQKCHGVWLSFDSFDKLPALSSKDIAAHQEPTESEHTLSASTSERVCPDCKAPLINFHFRNQIWLDWCSDGHGLWLDRGELAQVHEIRQQAESLSPEEKQHALEQVHQFSKPR